MRLTIFGASGLTGTCLVSQALDLGHDVTAFVRTPGSVAQTHPNLDVVVGDVASATDVERVVNGQDVVMMSLGVKMGVPDQVCTIATATIVPAMQKFMAANNMTADQAPQPRRSVRRRSRAIPFLLVCAPLVYLVMRWLG